MAKLGVAYGLCPLIDECSLFGVTSDSDASCVIVSLGRNIVIRYKLQDQKQVNSWSTKDKLTSAVIYNSVDNCYVGVFNYNQIRTWTENENNLDKVKKIRFQQPIHCILSSCEATMPVILFKNGSVMPLKVALDKRKQEHSNSFLDSDEIIEESYAVSSEGRTFVAFTTRKTKNDTYLYVIPATKENQYRKIPLLRSETDVTIKGTTIIQDGNVCHVLTLWSDGKLFSLKILPSTEEESPGTLVQSVTSVSTKTPVVLIALNTTYLALYGADPSDEGALMLVLNLQFRLIQSRLHFKLFNSRPHVWRVGSSLFLPVGLSLVVVPFRVGAERLSALLGSGQPLVAEVGSWPATAADWGGGVNTDRSIFFASAPGQIKERLQLMAADGWPQGLIFQIIVPELLEKKDVGGLKWCLANLSDIPEATLVQVLSFILSENDSTFIEDESAMDVDQIIMNGNLSDKTDDNNGNITDVEPLRPLARLQLLRAALDAQSSDARQVAHLRTLPLNQVLFLLRHLVSELKHQGPDAKVLEWSCALLDASYQQLLLSRDIQVVHLLSTLRNLVSENLSYMQDLKKIAAMLHRLKAGKSITKQHVNNKMYSVETLHLY